MTSLRLTSWNSSIEGLWEVDCFVGLFVFFFFLSDAEPDEQTRTETSGQLRWAEPKGAKPATPPSSADQRSQRSLRRRPWQGMKAAAGGRATRSRRSLAVRLDVGVRGQEDAGHMTRLSCPPGRNLLHHHLHRSGGVVLRGGASSPPSVSLSWEVPFPLLCPH